MRFQPPGLGRSPSGIGRPELFGPLSNNRNDPSVTSANAGAVLERSVKPGVFRVPRHCGINVIDDAAPVHYRHLCLTAFYTWCTTSAAIVRYPWPPGGCERYLL